MRLCQTLSGTGSRDARIACVVALFFLMQSFLSPLIAHAGASRMTTDGPAVASLLGEICHDDAGDPAGKTHHNHGDCCILCGGPLRDAAILFVVAWAVTEIAAPQQVQRFAANAIPDDARPRASGWASSWSSRAPPSFS